MEQRDVGHEIRCLGKEISRFVDVHLNKNEIDRITGANGWIIGYIASKGESDVYQRDLEAEFGITRSTASKVVDLMVKKGFIERRGVSHDGRLKKLLLTEKAREIAELMQSDRRAVEAALTRGLTEDELSCLLQLIGRLRENIKTAYREETER